MVDYTLLYPIIGTQYHKKFIVTSAVGAGMPSDLIVGCKENYNVEITNSTGQQFLQKSNQTASELSFDLGNYPAGIYFIRLSDTKGDSVSKKIIKE